MRVGVFDSGVGGLTVLSELRKHFSELGYIYLGDTAHVPYGTKSAAQVERLSLECVEKLKEYGVDLLVVACNTATSVALPAIQAAMAPVPVFGVVEPGVEAALAAWTSGPILVLATAATVRSGAYRRALERARGKRHIEIIEKACPLLVPMIEEGWVEHPILEATVAEYVRPFVQMGKPGVALLGCTHYPWIQDVFARALPGWTVVNSARAVVEAVERAYGAGVTGSGSIEFVFTDPQAVPEFARVWCKIPVTA